jgi:hypothetical protein
MLFGGTGPADSKKSKPGKKFSLGGFSVKVKE